MNNQQIQSLYDSFGPDGQNMTLDAFTNAVHDLTDPAKMQQDLDKINMQRATERSNKLNIDRKLNHG